MLNNTTILISIFNEEKNIWLLIEWIIKKYWLIKIIIIDDFSNDNSKKIIEKYIKKYGAHIKLISKNKNDNKWLTDSIIKWILIVKTKYFIVMDWDFQHPIKNIFNFLELYKQWKKIVIWERKKIIFKEKKYRILISKIWNFLINLKLSNINLKDPLSWFFWWESHIFKNTIKNNPTIFIKTWYKFLFEFLKVIQIDKKDIWTFNFHFKKRKFWKSKINNKVYLDFIKWLLK